MVKWLLWTVLIVLSRNHRVWRNVRFDSRFGTYGVEGAEVTRRQAEAIAWLIS